MSIEQTGHMTILFIENQETSKAFYERVFGFEPILHVPGMTEFKLTPHLSLGLMPEKGIMKILDHQIPDPHLGHGISRHELYLFVDDPALYFNRLIDAGGQGISPPKPRSWGDMVAYGTDPDGHLLAFALKR